MDMRSILPLVALLPGQVLAETVLGVYIFHRHGDRTSKAYKPTSLTALGADEVYTSGDYYRNRYIASNSTSPILNMASDIVVLSQLDISASSDDVLMSSSAAFTQSLYPPAGSAAIQTLADGDEVEAPLDGYQYIPISVVSSSSSSSSSTENSAWLQGSSGCAKAVTSSDAYYDTEEYLNLLNSTNTFYQDLLPVYNTTFNSSKATFKNAYTIYDYVHVSEIHNSSIPSSDLLTNASLHQLQTLADTHEWGLAYNESEPIRAIAGAVLAAQILSALNDTVTSSLASTSSQRLGVQFGSYGTFMSFFGLAGLPAASEDFKGIADYASSMVFELVTNATVNGTDAPTTVDPADVSVRFLFANGSASDSNPPQEYALFGQSETLVSWNDFATNVQEFAIGDTQSWCQACGNTTGTCASSSASSGSVSSKSSISAGAAAAAGVCSMLGFVLLLLLGAALGGFRVVKKNKNAASLSSTTGDVEKNSIAKTNSS